MTSLSAPLSLTSRLSPALLFALVGCAEGALIPTDGAKPGTFTEPTPPNVTAVDAITQRAASSVFQPLDIAAELGDPLFVAPWQLHSPTVEATCSRVERCNGIDDDCNGLIDDQAFDAHVYYADQDGDGFGDSEARIVACQEPEGFVTQGGDPDDLDEEVPGTDVELPEDLRRRGTLSVLDADQLVTGTFDFQRLGMVLAAGGDLNDDGLEELVVSYISAPNGALDHYLIYGPEAEPRVASLVLRSSAAGMFVGTPVIDGDVDGDAFDDLVAAFLRPDGVLGVCVMYGRRNPINRTAYADTCDATYIAGQVGEEVEVTLTVGDLTMDGAAEVVVGSPNDDTVAEDAGAIYVIEGPIFGVVETPMMARFGAEEADMLGEQLALIDPESDHVDELVWMEECTLRTWSEEAGEQQTRLDEEGACPLRVTVLEDLNGDDGDELGFFYGRAGDEPGYLTIHLSGEGLTGGETVRVGGSSELGLHSAMATSADLDGDGWRDLIVGAPLDMPRGHVAVFYGPVTSPLSTADADLSIRGVTQRNALGYRVTTGDLDGDGADELFIGDPFASFEADAAGAVYVIKTLFQPADAT